MKISDDELGMFLGGLLAVLVRNRATRRYARASNPVLARVRDRAITINRALGITRMRDARD